MSLSAGAVIPIVVQVLLLSWNGLLRAIKFRWQILIGLSVSISLAIQLVANRSVLDIVVSFFVFEPGSYWYRRLIWDYGSASVLNHPLYGVGLNDWERPAWMSASIDNFWLFLAMRYGLPAAFSPAADLFVDLLGGSFKKGLGDKIIAYRTAFLITMTGFFLVGWTVAFWDHAYVFFLFLMGSGVWMLDVETKGESYLAGAGRLNLAGCIGKYVLVYRPFADKFETL